MKKIVMLAAIACLACVSPLRSEEADKPPYYLSAEALDESLGVDANAAKPADFVRAVYFHRVPGCATCQKMSKYIFETAKTQFADQLKNKKLVLRYMNFEDPKYAKLAQAFDVKSPTLVIVEVKAGKDARYKKAARIWELSGDEAKFQTYVAEEFNAWLAPAKEEK